MCSFVAIITISNSQFSYAQKMSTVTTKIIPLKMDNSANSLLTKLKTGTTNATLIPRIRITSPYNGQNVPVTNDKNLLIVGTSSDDKSKDCIVSILLNGVKPYQKTIATGKYGANDYSGWKYMLDSSYTVIREGSNKLTAKISCLDNPDSFNKWTSIDLIGTRGYNDSSIITGAAQPMTLQILISVDKDRIAAGDTQTITLKVRSPGITNTAISGAKVNGQIIDLSSLSSPSSPSSFPSKNMNATVEQFDGNADRNGEVSYSWRVPVNAQIGTPYIIKVDALSGKYSGRSESNIFTVEPSNNDNPFILAHASNNFTNGLNDNIKNLTREIFSKVTRSLENNLK
jgi:hypothetical protein